MATRPRHGSARATREREMRRVLKDLERSGLSQRGFCEQRGIALSTLTWWRRKLRKDEGDGGERRPSEAPFLELEVVEDEPQASISPVELHLPGGAVVRIDPGVSEDTLFRVFRAARRSC